MIRKLPVWVWFGGVTLTFTAGLVNAVALLSFTNEAATHVTGTITQTANALVLGNWDKTLHLSTVVLAFFSGSVISGIITRGSRLRLGRRYGFALALDSFFLTASMLLFQHHPLRGQLLASLACGLQNGMLTTFSGAIIRTTHMTGIVTDLGTKIGHWLSGSTMDKRRFTLYLLLLSGFTTGGITGTALFARWGYTTLIFPIAITGIASILYTVYAVRVHQKQGDTYL